MQKQSARIKCKNNLFKPASDIMRSVKTTTYDQNNKVRLNSSRNIYICYLPAGRSVWWKTETEVLKNEIEPIYESFASQRKKVGKSRSSYRVYSARYLV